METHGNQFLNDGVYFTLQATAVKLAQADSVANLPDGSDKFSQRNPKMDFRDSFLIMD